MYKRSFLLLLSLHIALGIFISCSEENSIANELATDNYLSDTDYIDSFPGDEPYDEEMDRHTNYSRATCTAPTGAGERVLGRAVCVQWPHYSGAGQYQAKGNKLNGPIAIRTTSRNILTFNLAPNTTYIWQIRAECSDGTWSEWSEARQFTTDANLGIPKIFSRFMEEVNIYIDGDQVVLESNNLPNHTSPYYPQGSGMYEAYNGDNPNFNTNPFQIQMQNATYRIPLNPQEANSHQNTQLGSIGISTTSVGIFNQYAAGFQALGNQEINSFDQYYGHPQPTGFYHYHWEPRYLTSNYSKEVFIGFLLDGFPIYGPEENGQMITNSDLDQYHGHFGPTPDYPNGIYHYHITTEDPYINGGQYYGTPGSMTN